MPIINYSVKNTIKRKTIRGTTDAAGNMLLWNSGFNYIIPIAAFAYNSSSTPISCNCVFYQGGASLYVSLTGVSKDRIIIANTEVFIDFYYMEK